ncbi:hypothetical protein HRD78_01020 [Enterococcus faecalis]|nr:hypothetical protein [Enterococcus faecalis]
MDSDSYGIQSANTTENATETQENLREKFNLKRPEDFEDPSAVSISEINSRAVNWAKFPETVREGPNNGYYVTGYFKDWNVAGTWDFSMIANNFDLIFRQSRNSFAALEWNETQLGAEIARVDRETTKLWNHTSEIWKSLDKREGALNSRINTLNTRANSMDNSINNLRNISNQLSLTIDSNGRRIRQIENFLSSSVFVDMLNNLRNINTWTGINSVQIVITNNHLSNIFGELQKNTAHTANINTWTGTTSREIVKTNNHLSNIFAELQRNTAHTANINTWTGTTSREIVKTNNHLSNIFRELQKNTAHTANINTWTGTTSREIVKTNNHLSNIFAELQKNTAHTANINAWTRQSAQHLENIYKIVEKSLWNLENINSWTATSSLQVVVTNNILKEIRDNLGASFLEKTGLLAAILSIKDSIDNFKELFDSYFKIDNLTALMAHEGVFVRMLKSQFISLKNLLTELFDPETGTFTDFLADMFYKVRYTTIQEFSELNDFLTENFASFLGALNTVNEYLNMLLNKGFDFKRLEEILNGLSFGNVTNEAGENIWSVLKELISTLGNILSNGFGTLSELIQRIFDFLDSLIDTVISLIIPKNWDFLSDGFGAISNEFTLKFSGVLNIGTQLNEVFKPTNKDFFSAVSWSYMGVTFDGQKAKPIMDQFVPKLRIFTQISIWLMVGWWLYKKITGTGDLINDN